MKQEIGQILHDPTLYFNKKQFKGGEIMRLMLQKTILGTFILVILIAMVYAFTLVQETKVLTCDDTDYGLNESVRGMIYGLTLTNQTYNATDYCAGKISNQTLVEHACYYGNNTVKAQKWLHNCTNSCFAGKCV